MARLVQGLAGGVGIVIAQAAGRDIFTGGALIRFYGRLTVVGGFAAIVGPLLGGHARHVHRLARTVRLPRRHRRRHPRPHARGVPRDAAARTPHPRRDSRRRCTTSAPSSPTGCSSERSSTRGSSTRRCSHTCRGRPSCCRTSMDSPRIGYALAFGLNSAGFMIFGYLAGRAAERWSIAGTLAIGILVAGLGAVGPARLRARSPMPLWVVIVSLFAPRQRRRDHRRRRRRHSRWSNTRRSPAPPRRCWAWSGSGSAGSPPRWSASPGRSASFPSAW